MKQILIVLMIIKCSMTFSQTTINDSSEFEVLDASVSIKALKTKNKKPIEVTAGAGVGMMLLIVGAHADVGLNFFKHAEVGVTSGFKLVTAGEGLFLPDLGAYLRIRTNAKINLYAKYYKIIKNYDQLDQELVGSNRFISAGLEYQVDDFATAAVYVDFTKKGKLFLLPVVGLGMNISLSDVLNDKH